MPSRARAFAFTGLALLIFIALGIAKFSLGKKMQEIKFDLGHDIVETARTSGVPSFSARDVDGLVSYSVNSIPATIPAHFTRPGLEVVWQPLFAFTMYADEKRDPARPVETVTLQLHNDFVTDAQAQAFVEQTIAQFQKGRWQRYYDPTWNALLTGRSSFLDQNGKITSPSMTIDPGHKIQTDDWIILVRNGATWRWVGGGVLAQLSVDADRGEGTAAPAYRINLDFNLLDVKLKQDENTEEKKRKEGDAKGWNSTVEYEKSKVERLTMLKTIEANAIKRGDKVLAPH